MSIVSQQEKKVTFEIPQEHNIASEQDLMDKQPEDLKSNDGGSLQKLEASKSRGMGQRFPGIEQNFEIVFDDNFDFMKTFLQVKDKNNNVAVDSEDQELTNKLQEVEINEDSANNLQEVEINEDSDDNLQAVEVNGNAANNLQTVEVNGNAASASYYFLVPQVTKNIPLAWNIAQYMSEVGADLKFFNNYVKMMRDPSSYQMEVTRAFRINGLHPARDTIDYVANHTLLMHGVHHKKLYYFLRNGFNDSNGASGKRMFFGRGFYFTDCSTKAFNFASERDAYKFERKADEGECQPDPGNFGYILVCDVALGSRVTSVNQLKYNDFPFTKGDSLISFSKYKAKENLKLHLPITKYEGSLAVTLPYGGQSNQDDINCPGVTKFADYCVYDPKQIEMCWLLEVRRIPDQETH